MGAEQQLAALVLIALGNLLAGLVEHLVHESALRLIELLHERLELQELGLVGLVALYRSGDDERGARVVDEYGVHLVHDGVVVLALHEVLLHDGHIVTQIVETELVVGAEGDVAVVCLAAGVGVGLVLVDAVHGKPVEHIQGPHPLGVTPGEVVVDRHHVHSLARKGVEEHRQRCDESLALAGGHLRYLALMQSDAAYELHVVMHHIPSDFVASGYPVVAICRLVAVYRHEVVGHGEVLIEFRGRHDHFRIFLETAGRGLHYREGFRKHLFQTLLYRLVFIFDEFVRFVRKLLLFRNGNIPVQFFLYRHDAALERSLHLTKPLPESGRPLPESVCGQGVNLRIDGENLLKRRLNRLIVAVGLGAEHFPYY